MITEFLTDKETKIAKEIWNKHVSNEYDVFIRFWSKDEVQVDGSLELNHVIALKEILEVLNHPVR